MSKKTVRKVKKRNNQINITKGKVPSANRPTKQTMVGMARQINRTKTRRYMLCGVGCLISMQLVKFVAYDFIYVGNETPGGMVFLIFIYLQTGLMLGSLGFFVASALAYLRSLKS